ncbi:helicase protein MOM1-like isoform X2 [Rhodamnia argentea]|nr:helicase protein MOM1-like isoform X2 [Rhodamnia argentea]XP_048137316.1 helicase protein MOM1-like isoform X2 [Rhodamnia argentea]
MVNQTRSGCKIGDECTNKVHSGGKGSSTSDFASDSYGLRRSTRESSSKKPMIPSFPSTRKSERLEKQTPPTSVSKDPKKVKRQRTPSPVRRSERCKKLRHSSDSAISKKSARRSESSDRQNQMDKKETKAKQLEVEDKESSKSNEEEPASTLVKRGKLSARAYRALFRKGNKDKASDCREELSCPNESFQPEHSNSVAGPEEVDAVNGCSDCNQKIKEGVESMTKTVEKQNEENTCLKQNNHSTQQAMAGCQNVTTAERNFVQIDGINSKRKSGEPEATVNLELGEKQNLHVLVKIDEESGQNTCFICKLGGKLLYCDGAGCQRHYHLSCLDPPLNDVPLGVWHCLACVRKMMKYGAYSVSEGVESIWDCREVEVSNPNGWQMQKQFFVKYKGLAHFHNRWLPEAEVAAKWPSLVASFLQKKQVVPWKSEWALPRRLLQKRLITSPQFHSERDRQEEGTDVSMCHYQWLVKWCGLDYEHASWELENASLFLSSETQSLFKQYENRLDRATGACNVEVTKLPERKKSLRNELSELPAKVILGPENNHADLINSHIIVDDQEHILKVTSFVLSLERDGCLPFLIISPSTSVHSWDAEFFRLAPTLNVVVFNGSKDARKFIRNLEFSEEGASLAFQVLISPPEAIVEDMDILTQMEWEAIVVDECQQPRTLSFSEEFKKLKTQSRLLLFNGNTKENVSEYRTLLSMLDDHGEIMNALAANSHETVHKLKERLFSYTALEGNTDSSRFVEYWVPAQISNVQLEQYCATLLSNSLSLCSSSKVDPVGVLRDILVSARKCCNYSYDVDPSLQGPLRKDLQPIDLDVGRKASGKLQLLDRLLSESKKQHLKVLILFQSIGGSGRDLTGDVLDDFLRLRFGADSYERVDGGILPSKKQSALTKFNDKELGRFVFLLENRACNPSIKLSSVDMVIIFDSDWNPASDLRNLQKLTIESQVQIKVLRLYLSCTVEEKALICAKQGMHLESKLQNISPRTSHMLLMWGASFLMRRLDEFHGSSSVSSMELSDQLLANSVVQEFLALMLQNENSVKSRSVIVKAQQTSGTYCTDFPLVGELMIQSTAEDLPYIFWTKLLEGKHPCWKYCSGSTPRSRKRLQSYVNIFEEVGSDSNKLAKKRKKSTYNSISPSSRKQRLDGEKKVAANKEGTSSPFIQSLGGEDLAAIPEGKMVDSDEGRKLRDAQRSLYLLLKPEILRLSDLLNLSDNIKGMVNSFLDYVITNHHVSRESASILQAFQLALCWTAVSLSKEKIDHTECLELAKKHLNYQCKKEEADHVYSMLRDLKKKFLQLRKKPPVDSLKYGELKEKVLQMEQSGLKSPLPAMPCLQPVKVEIEDCTFQGSSSNEVISSPTLMDEFGLTLGDISERGREIQDQKQKLQGLEARKDEICRESEAQKVLLESNHKLEAAIVRLHCGGSTKIDRMKRLDREYSTQIEECSREMAMHLKEIDAEHLASANGVQQEPSVVEGDGCSTHTQVLNKLPEARQGQESSNCHDQLDNVDPFLRPSVDQSADVIVHTEKDCLPVKIGSDKDEMSTVASGTVSTEVGPCANGTQIDNQGNAVSLNPCPQENLPVNSQGDFFSNHALENDSTMDACTWVDQIPDGSRKEAIDKWGPVEVQESVHLTNILERSSSPDPQASETERPNGSESGVVDSEGPHKASLVNQSISRMPNGRDKVGATDHTLENISSLNACSLDDQIRDGSRMEALDELAAVEVQENICISGEPEEMISPDPHIPETEICNGSESEVLENVHPRDGPREVALVNQSKSTTVLPSRAFAEGASVSSHSTLPDQELRADCNATSTRGQEINAPNQEQHNDETLPDEESRDDCNVTSMSVQEKNAPGKQQHDAEVASTTSHHSAPHQDLRDDCNPGPAITQEGNIHDEVQQNAEGASMPSYLTLPEEELRVNCKAASTGMQERNAPEEEQHNAEGASISSCHTLSGQEMGDDFNALSSSMRERNAPNEEQHNASQQTEFLSSSTGNATSSFSGAADMEPPVLLPPQDQPLNHSSHDLALVSGTATPLQGVGETSNLTVHSQSTQIAENPAVPPNQAMSESAVSIPRGGMVAQVSGNSTASISVESSTQLLQSPFPMAQPRMPLKLHLDPLQNELDRIQREMEQMDKSHEDAKLLLVSDCGKEIEEIVAQIRRKYDLKLKEIEAEYLAKKKELDMNQGKVLMNRMLAEAFKSKCSDIRASGANGIQQDVASGSMQQLLQLSSQRNAHQPLPVRGPSAGLQSNGVRTIATPFTSSESFPPNVASFQNVGPSGVTILDSSAVSSGIASRPPQISLSMPPPSANIQAPSDLRSPAPHLQAFRPSIASSGTPSQGLPNQQPPSNPPTTSAPLQQLPLAAVPPAGAAGPSSRHHGGGSVGGFLPNELGSDLLRDIFHPLIIAASQRDNLTSSSATADVVCLSDDD